MKRSTFTALALLAALFTGSTLAAEIKLLNVSYDPIRELYQEYNAAFAKHSCRRLLPCAWR